MHKPKKLMIAGLVLGVGLSACGQDRQDRVADTVSTPGTAATPGIAMSSSDLEDAVKAKFQTDDQLRAANINVNADTDKKEITLSGTVPSQDLRTHAVDLAKSTQAGMTVNDKIDVKPAA
jgi:osmotically-inducible protein OsmY